jgi:hypothetical protein
MPESTLSLPYSYLVERLRRYLGFASSPSGDNLGTILEMIDSGLRLFYTAHPWQFLRASGTITTSAATWQYNLPEDFGVLEGRPHYTAGQYYCALSIESLDRVLENRATSSISMRPGTCAISAKATDLLLSGSTTGQRFEMSLWPTPDATYALTYRYAINPFAIRPSIERDSGTDGTVTTNKFDATSVADWTALSIDTDTDVLVISAGAATAGTYAISSVAAGELTLATTPTAAGTATVWWVGTLGREYPLGGMMHSETILTACLAAAEKYRNDEIGPMNAEFNRLLGISIKNDQRTGPQFTGYNGDPSIGLSSWPHTVADCDRNTTVTYTTP